MSAHSPPTDLRLPLEGLIHSLEEKRMVTVDPVCKMMVNPERAAYRSEYNGETYYFCRIGCMMAFDKDPEKYLRRAKGGGAPLRTRTR